jgi:glutathione S-transferase
MELYCSPLTCSLAVRIVAHEAEIPLTLHRLDRKTKILTDTGASYLDILPTGLVPALRTDDGVLLTETCAVAPYLADQRPASGLAPPPGSLDRYRHDQWLSFVATELHKKVLWPIFTDSVPDPVKAFARTCAPPALDHVSRALDGHAYLVGDRFTCADAYLVWALRLAQFARLDPTRDRPSIAAYVDRTGARPSVTQLFAEELAQLRQ